MPNHPMKVSQASTEVNHGIKTGHCIMDTLCLDSSGFFTWQKLESGDEE